MAKQIMTVDDSPSIRQIIKLSLAAGGYSIVEASDGIDALDMLLSIKNVDMFILDVNMPRMDGITLVEKLRQLPEYAKTPVVMLTTESSYDKKTAGKRAGANGWIVKPFDPPKLLKVVDMLLK